jgi:hypothetical protein
VPEPGTTVERLAAAECLPLLRDAVASGELRLRLRGDCMQPRLEDGTPVRVRRRRLYLPGDVVAVRGWDGRLLAHRLLGGYRYRGRWMIITRADNGQVADIAVPASSLLGAVECPGLTVSWRERARSCLHLASAVRRRLAALLRGRLG